MYIKAKYDPLLFKLPKGVISKNNYVKFFVEFNDEILPNIVYFMIKNDSENDYKYLEMTKVCGGYEISYYFAKKGHFWYNFQLVYNDYCCYLNKTFDCRSKLEDFKGEDYLQLVTQKEYDCKNSMQGGIIYQIFVDRFCKVGEVKEREPLHLRDDWGGAIKKYSSNPIILNLEVFGGNFQGIISKLDYLKNLGITTIYLSPIAQANSNHKYNTLNYKKIDDMLGTENDFIDLVNLAKQRDIEIIIDGVYNHTGSDSIYFDKERKFDSVGAFESKDSKYYSWYNFGEDNNTYSSWWGIETLPSINRGSNGFQTFIAGENGIIDKYMKYGISGIRLDVVDEITDVFVQKIEKKIHEFGKNKVVLGEVWEDASTKISYSERRKYFVNNELNSVMNYPIKESVLNYIFTQNSNNLESTIRMIENNYPKVVRDNLMNFLTTHDTKRVFSEILNASNNDEKLAKILYKIALVLIFTLPGVPSIFYGDEYGMQNNDDSSRGCFDWKNYNNDIYNWILKLTKIRKISALKDGEIDILYSGNGKFAFERFNNKERVVVIINLGNDPLNINLNGEYQSFFDNKKTNNHVLNKNEFDILIETKNV